jgi:hypothetical protein
MMQVYLYQSLRGHAREVTGTGARPGVNPPPVLAALAAHAVLAHFLDQGGTTDTQTFGRARNDAVGIVQRLLDQPCSRLPR